MMQIVPCECGETLMNHGRCTGCKRVRPSAREASERVKDLGDQLVDAIEDLRVAIELEGIKPTGDIA
jgi:hypothetical protein